MALTGIMEMFLKTRAEQAKSIPSKVFFNHFFSIIYCLNCNSEKFELKKIPYYNDIKIKNSSFNIDEVRKLLWNSWSTEYAYRIGEKIDNDEYYKFSLHWNFPQAYYSVYLSMTAFHETQGLANEQHEKSIKLFGNSIKDNHYPSAISFYSSGLKNEFEYQGLPTFKEFPKDSSVLRKIECLEDAEIQLATFLKTTRKRNAEDKRNRLAKQNDKRFRNGKGEFRKSFSKNHWDIIYKTIPITSIFNLLYRLRIKANYRDIESFINADIDFKSFHSSLGELIYYLNFVHEAYIAKAIGIVKYEKILNSFPSHLNKETAIKRFEENIKVLG
ncbi:hypothetical protein [Polaribacter dokdonensis]|uniref:Uncharacterized protein n=2 Tax=Polaribacter dokdonensis DSW-5 TaxID=1300348 RepID=A0A1H5J0H1_9FLAO|nr:hypothetical protein [Polaribacter dokdonensis]SEE45148.1 hypothetical protein SAMN05444353_1750 [Polaribacter dokdonensis DSW-5]